MSSLIKSAGLSKNWLRNNAILVTAVRNHWNKDYKPGPYPKTEEERLAAAEKYGLHPSEYKPYPDDGTGFGDYPDLPFESSESRDPFYPWDNPELKRNFNEPLHAYYDLIREDRYDVSAKLRTPLRRQFLEFFGVMTAFGVVYYLLEQIKMFTPVAPPQLPGTGKTHYTFEPKDA